MTMFMTLGDLAVELLSSPTAFDTRAAANYAEHSLIGRKSLLQHTGFAPDDVSISIRLHALYCNPAEIMQSLNDLKDNKTVFAVVLASGEYKGTFVLKETSVTLTETTATGAIIGLEASLSLAEYIGDPAQPNPPGVLSAGVTLNLLSEPLPEVASPQGLLGAVKQGLEVAGKVQKAASKVNDIVATAKNGDLLGAVGLAGSYAPALSEMAAQLPVEQFQDLEGFKAIATDTGNAARALATTRDSLNNAAGLMQGSSTLSGLLSASDNMGTALTAAASATPSLDRLAAAAEVGSRLAGIPL